MTVLAVRHFNYFAGSMLKRANRDGMRGRERDFTSLFGISANVCSVVWNLCDFPTGTKPIHLLWAFLFLKIYGTEPVLLAIVGGPTRKTFRKWVWIVMEEVAAKAPSVVSCYCCLIIKKKRFYRIAKYLLFFASDPMGEQVPSRPRKDLQSDSRWH